MAVSWTPHQLVRTASDSYSKWALFCKSLENFPIPAMFIFKAFESNEDWAVQMGKISRISKGLCHVICYIFQKSVNMSSYQLNSKNIGSVLLFKIIIQAWKSFPVVCYNVDGKDRHVLKLEKVEPNFSSFNALPANINLKKIIKVSAAWFNVFFMTLW